MNKKLLKSFFAVVLAFAGVLAISHYGNAAVNGDVNGDGSVTAADVTAVYDVLLGNNADFEATADVNHDGSVTAADVTFIYDILLGNTPAEFEHVYILGNAAEWSPVQGQEMTTEDGVVYTATLEAGNIYDGYSYFGFTTKLADAQSETAWDDIEAYRFGAITDGDDFLVTNETMGTAIALTNEDYHAFKIAAGKYELSLNLNEMTLVITKVEEPQPETEVYILGEVNGNTTWSAYNGVQMTTEDGVVFTSHVTTTGENNGYSYFSFTKALADPNSETPWVDIESQRFGAASEGDFLVTSEMAGQPLPLTYENVQAFKVPAGEYDLTVNMTEMTLVIEGEIVDPVTPQPENKVYILGDVNGNEWATNNGVEMTTEDNKIYTATITTETFSYFSFTTALSEAADDWDGIAEYRFGAVGDADVLVTEDYLGEALPLTNTGYQALKIAAGEFALTLNMEEMTLKIEGEFAPQPQPENNWYLVGTNNGWSTSDMSYKFTQSTENENVYSIHVDNVSGDFWFKIANEDCYTAADFWGGTIFGAATNGESALSGNLVLGAEGAFCIPSNYNCTYLDITIDVENLTYTIATDGQEPVIDPTAEYDYVYIAGTADGWSGNGGKLASIKDANDYYGFINATGEFKIQKSQGSWATNWGGSNGTLVASGNNIAANGFVYVNANIGNMTYSVTPITSMGIIGDATAGGWDAETALTYNAENNTWEATDVVLTAGTIKFRANNAWEINFGGALDNLTINGENITVEAGTYKVVLSLVCPGEYTATLIPAN